MAGQSNTDDLPSSTAFMPISDVTQATITTVQHLHLQERWAESIVKMYDSSHPIHLVVWMLLIRSTPRTSHSQSLLHEHHIMQHVTDLSSLCFLSFQNTDPWSQIW